MSSITPQNHKTRRVLLTALTPHPHISLSQPYTVSKMKETGDEEQRKGERKQIRKARRRNKERKQENTKRGHKREQITKDAKKKEKGGKDKNIPEYSSRI